MDRTCAAHSDTASILCAREVQDFSDYPEQRHIGRYVNSRSPTINSYFEGHYVNSLVVVFVWPLINSECFELQKKMRNSLLSQSTSQRLWAVECARSAIAADYWKDVFAEVCSRWNCRRAFQVPRHFGKWRRHLIYGVWGLRARSGQIRLASGGMSTETKRFAGYIGSLHHSHQ